MGMLDFANVTLDTTSEYIIEDDGMVSVIVTGFEENIKAFVGDKNNIDYGDIYAYIDPRTNLVPRFHVTITYLDDKFDFSIEVEGLTKQAEIFHEIITSDSELQKVIEKAKNELHGRNMEEIGCIIDTFEDFLSDYDEGIKLPRSEVDKKEAGDPDNTAKIYGRDYDELSERLLEGVLEHLSQKETNKTWWRAWYNFCSHNFHKVDEVDFVTEATNRGIDDKFVLDMTKDEGVAMWFKQVAEEHGLM